MSPFPFIVPLIHSVALAGLLALSTDPLAKLDWSLTADRVGPRRANGAAARCVSRSLTTQVWSTVPVPKGLGRQNFARKQRGAAALKFSFCELDAPQSYPGV